MIFWGPSWFFSSPSNSLLPSGLLMKLRPCGGKLEGLGAGTYINSAVGITAKFSGVSFSVPVLLLLAQSGSIIAVSRK